MVNGLFLIYFFYKVNKYFLRDKKFVLIK